MVAKKESGKTTASYTQRFVTQIMALAAITIVIVLWQHNFLIEVYVRNQLTYVGWFINGGILVLFSAGLYRLVQEFQRLTGEEQAIDGLLANMKSGHEPTAGIKPDAIISRRYHTLRELHRQHSVINHSALAATLVAIETSKISFPKFVHNVLILTGVFGTVLALSIALLGASDMIVTTTEIGGLGMIIHGMSTALSTTMTAIFAYLFFGYFYLRLMDAQTHVIGRVEEVTSTVLLPQFQFEPERAAEQLTHIVHSAAALVERLDESQAQYAEVAQELRLLLSSYRDEMQRNSEGLIEMTHVLREGFRLNDPGSDVPPR